MKKTFWSLIVTQFFGAFNDNVLKFVLQICIIAWTVSPKQEQFLVSASGAVFVAPFLIFSMMAGRLADRFSKTRIAVWTKYWELVVVLAATLGLWQKSLPILMVSLFFLAAQSAFFSPAKYGILPEMMGEGDLPKANGILNAATFLAILVGMVAGILSASTWWIASLIMITAALAGVATARTMDVLPPAQPGARISLNVFTDLARNWRIIGQDRPLKLSILAINFFWLVGAFLQLNILLYVPQMMKGGQIETLWMVVSLTIGIACGSVAAAKLSQGKAELGLVPIGAIGMTLFGADLGFAYHSFARVAFDLFMIGFFGGIFDIPLMALIQWRAPAGDRGKVLSMVNFQSFAAILAASGLLAAFSAAGLNPAKAFIAFSIIGAIGAITICCFLPSAVLRLLIILPTKIIYRITVFGRDYVPSSGPALLVCNHLSLADGFLLGATLARLPRFVMWRPYYEMRGFHWLFKILKAIPVSDTDPPKEVLRSLMVARQALEAGHLVCVFAEGQISRTGNLLEFKRGFEVIVKGLDVPVVPVHLDRVWGSIFSFEHGKAIWKKPQRLPYPVTVTFGKPMSTPITPADARQAVQDLGSEAFAHRLAETQPLGLEFLKRAHTQPRALAVADSSGKKLSFGMLAAVVTAFTEVLENKLDAGQNIGILLPSSVGGVVANVALSLMGKIPINLNYTAGEAAIRLAMEKAGIRTVLTTPKLLEKIGLPRMDSMIMVEDLFKDVRKTRILWHRARMILPVSWLLQRWPKPSLEATATIMFSSGSTGVPKGIVLSHANVLSNVLALSQVFDVGRKDRMIGVLPFFHSFGFTATVWFPLIAGFSAVYHVNPLDARVIGELSGRYGATLLVATPTFLSAYTRKCTREQFAKLRFVITGAERLRESVAAAFFEKFGKEPLEGYGCTELSPVATVNVPNISMGEIHQVGRKAGTIGHPIPGVSVKIVDPETGEKVEQGKPGLLLVKGPNVMQGYLGEPEKTAEVIVDGWYRTGDIAMVDNDGFVKLVDRMSRFSKIGGEMVPHVMIEEKLQELSGSTEANFAVTSVPDEKRGERLVVLYHNRLSNEISGIYDKLSGSGLPNLWVPAKADFHPVEALPLLGTGKLDLLKLREIAKSKAT